MARRLVKVSIDSDRASIIVVAIELGARPWLSFVHYFEWGCQRTEFSRFRKGRKILAELDETVRKSENASLVSCGSVLAI